MGGFWQQFLNACEKEYRLNGEHPVDKYEWEKHDRELRERDRRREERERAHELEFQRKYVCLTLPERLKRFEHDRDRLKAEALKLTGKNLDDYVGPSFSDAIYEINQKSAVNGRVISGRSCGGGCSRSSGIHRNYDQEDAEAHEQYINSVCTAVRLGRAMRIVEDVQFGAAKRRH